MRTPFSIGPRACIGAQLAMSEALVILAMLLQRAHFDLVDARRDRERWSCCAQWLRADPHALAPPVS